MNEKNLVRELLAQVQRRKQELGIPAEDILASELKALEEVPLWNGDCLNPYEVQLLLTEDGTPDGLAASKVHVAGCSLCQQLLHIATPHENELANFMALLRSEISTTLAAPEALKLSTPIGR